MQEGGAQAEGVIVRRPEPGLARGRWEAPPWAFVVIALLALGVAAAVVARRFRSKRRA